MRRPAHKIDNLTAICWRDCLYNVGSLTSHDRIVLHGLLWGSLYFFYVMMLAPHRKHAHASRPVTEVALLFHM
jgi:hypothetical protein